MNYNIDQFTYNGDTYNFVDNTSGYIKTSSAAASGGTDLSLVTTGEKYTWNNKSSLTLGTTNSTAYRGDYGNTAYNHATDSNRLTTATSSGLYKIASTAQGHIASLTAISKTDITGLGIPAQDTTYSSLTAASGGTDVSLVTTGQKYTWNNKANITFGTDQTKFLRNDGNWAVPAGGSGGGSITQTNTTTGTAYRILFSDGENDNNEVSTTVRKNSGLIFNPQTTTLQTSGTILSTNNTNDEVFGAGSSSYRYHISVGSRYLRVRDSGVDGTAPNTSNISSTLVLSPVALNIIDGWNTSSGNYTLRAALSNNELRFQNSSNSYSVTPTKITSWDTTASKTAGIGTVHTSSGTKSNIPSSGPSTYYEFANFSVQPGKWLIMITARFPSNSAGERAVCLSTSSATTGINAVRDTDIRVPISGNPTFCKVTTVYNNSGSTNQTLYINGYQNSGSSTAMTVSYGYHAIKISN